MARKDFAAMESRRAAGGSAARDALRSRMAHPTRLTLDEVQPNPQNPRYEDDDPEVKELAETLTRVGQLQPALVVALDEYLRVYPDQRSGMTSAPWVVIVGNRRLAAARLAGRPALDVRVVENLTSEEHFEDRILIENIHRKDLPPLLEAAQLRRRLDRPGESFRSVGEAIGKSHAYVQQRIELLKLIPEFQTRLRDGQLNIKTGRQLGRLDEDEQRRRLAAGPPYLGSASTVPGNPVATEIALGSSDESVNRVATEELDAGQEAGGGEAESGSPSRPKVTPAAAPKPQPEPVQNTLETTRAYVMGYVESALSRLDNALPDGGDGDLGHALAESRRHLDAARAVLAEAQRAPAE